jgi:hypothetical protein
MNQIETQIMENMGEAVCNADEKIRQQILETANRWVSVRDQKIEQFLIPKLMKMSYKQIAREYALAVTAALKTFSLSREEKMVERFTEIVETYTRAKLFEFCKQNMKEQITIEN